MYHRILVPLDGSAPSERGLREAIRLATDQKATLFLLHVIDDYPVLSEGSSARSFEEKLERLRHHGSELLAKANDNTFQAGVQAKTVLRDVTQATVADAIVDEAQKLDCDLIVMGTHGRRGISRLTMGSEAELVVRTSPVPVLLVRKESSHSTTPAAA
jgi:nucleotide-binding universal stress UspA family protein